MALRKFVSKEIGNNIRTIRVDLNLSQEQFGRTFGNYSQDTVAKWEAGQVPHALVLKNIAEKGHRTVDWILGQHKEKEADIDDVIAGIEHGVKNLKQLASKGREKSRRSHGKAKT